MANYKTLHVFSDGDVWVVKRGDASKASAIRNTKKEALEAARDIALNQGLSITVHGKGNRIERVVNPQDRSSSSSSSSSGRSKSSDCFITTACVKYYGLEDNCYQLQTLRKFRDSFLLKSHEGKYLVKQYYSIAPALVHQLEMSENRKALFKNIFKKLNSACQAIEKQEYKKAQAIYVETVTHLLNYFKIH